MANANDPRQKLAQSTSDAREYAEDALDKTRDIAGRTADSASRYAQDAYKRSSRYMEQQRERYPKAERYMSYGADTVRRPVHENPILSMLVAGAIGYAIAYLIHGGGQRGTSGVPEYARAETRYR